MTIETQLATCNDGIQRWKEKALLSNDVNEVKKAMERAFFWMELRSAFIFLHTIEQSMENKETREKIIRAKINLSRKLSEHAKELLSQIK